MDLTAAAVFARVVEAKGFSAAGRLLEMPKTTVSKKVGALEAQLGVRLLTRTTRSVWLTEAGARVYTHCAAALRAMEAAEREALSLRNDPGGLLTLAAPTAISVPFLVPALTEFMARYPGVRVTLRAVAEDLDLEAERIDVMIWAGTARPAGHAVKLVASVENALYASRDYLAQHGTPKAPEELARHRAVIVTAARGAAPPFRWRLQRGETVVETTPTVQPRLRSNDPMAILAAVGAGQGIGEFPVRFVAKLTADRKLEPILPEWRAPPIELSALCRDQSSLRVRLFLDFLVDWFRRL